MLDKYEELSFIPRLGLKRLIRVPSGYTSECPMCLEGKSAGRKRRFFILTTSHKYKNVVVMCHNCSESMSLKNYLRHHEGALFVEYQELEKKRFIDNLRQGKMRKKQQSNEIETEELKMIPLPQEFAPLKDFALPTMYLKKRKIPKKMLERLYYCNTPNHNCSDMVIFPFYKGEEVYGYQGRSVTEKRFHNNVQEGFKLYNIYNVDTKKPVYIFESIIDSLFIENSVAMMGSDISTQMLKKLKEPIFIFDNDKTGIEKSLKYAFGNKIFIWPEALPTKDINEGIMKGTIEQQYIQGLITANTFKGLEAEARLKLRLRKMK